MGSVVRFILCFWSDCKQSPSHYQAPLPQYVTSDVLLGEQVILLDMKQHSARCLASDLMQASILCHYQSKY